MIECKNTWVDCMGCKELCCVFEIEDKKEDREDGYFTPFLLEGTKKDIWRGLKTDKKFFRKIPSGGWRFILIKRGKNLVCPLLNKNGFCRAHNIKPLDCVTYPFSLEWSKSKNRILLVIDEDGCPGVEAMRKIKKFNGAIKYFKKFFSEPRMVRLIKRNPNFIDKRHESAKIVCEIKALTKALC